MRETFRGWYKPTDAEAELLWERGTIVLDANVLLAPYRISPTARNRLFDALDAFREQLWVPYQAALEYQRHRLGVAAEQRASYDEIRRELDNSAKRLQNRRADHPALDPGEFRQVVTAAFDSIRRHVDRVEQGHPEVVGRDADEDVVRDKWDELLAARVGTRLETDEKWIAEAEQRYAAERPPGFEDRKKDKEARAYGDLIIWCEMLRFVQARAAELDADVPVIFVTDDAKRDWWRIEQGQSLGPHPELVEEIGAQRGRPFWIYSVGRFVQTAGQRMGWPSSGEVARELDEGGDANDHVDLEAGTEGLDAEGAPSGSESAVDGEEGQLHAQEDSTSPKES